MYQKIDFSNKPVLVGEKVILRPFQGEDWKEMLVILEEPELRRLTGSVIEDEEAEMATSEEEAEKIKEWYQSRNDKTDRLDLAVIDKEKDEIIGEVVFNEYDETTGNVNFRVLMRQSGCNKGFGTEAITIFIKYGMEVLKFHKIGLEVFSFNPRAERVYQKAGFVLEGIKREDFCYNGEYIDSKIYGMLREDYERK